MILDCIAILCLAGALALLVALSAVDLRERLLPNEMVLGFATLGLVFHLTTMGQLVSVPSIALGGVAGFGMLYVVRMAANAYYKADALGLGDVKLMGAGGLWLGPDGIMLAMAIGATAGMIHGLVHAMMIAKKAGAKPDLAHLQIPAGPGFAAGLIIAALFQFRHFSPFTLQ